jgi:hypothetical protein
MLPKTKWSTRQVTEFTCFRWDEINVRLFYKMSTRKNFKHSTKCRHDRISNILQNVDTTKLSNILQNVELIGLFIFSDKHPLRGVFIEVGCPFWAQFIADWCYLQFHLWLCTFSWPKWNCRIDLINYWTRLCTAIEGSAKGPKDLDQMRVVRLHTYIHTHFHVHVHLVLPLVRLACM